MERGQSAVHAALVEPGIRKWRMAVTCNGFIIIPVIHVYAGTSMTSGDNAHHNVHDYIFLHRQRGNLRFRGWQSGNLVSA